MLVQGALIGAHKIDQVTKLVISHRNDLPVFVGQESVQFGQLLKEVRIFDNIIGKFLEIIHGFARILVGAGQQQCIQLGLGCRDRNDFYNILIFCILISLSGPILGREARGWFVDMSAIGASIGFFFTGASTLVTMKKDGDGSKKLRLFAVLGVCFSAIFVVLQLIPIPGLSGVHFGKESYLMLIVWVILGLLFYLFQGKNFMKGKNLK